MSGNNAPPPAQESTSSKFGISGAIGVVAVGAALVSTAIVLKKGAEMETKLKDTEVRIGNLGKAIQDVPSGDSFKKMVDTVAKQNEQIHYLANQLKLAREREETLTVTVNLMVRKMREEGKFAEMDGLIMLQSARATSTGASATAAATTTSSAGQQVSPSG